MPFISDDWQILARVRAARFTELLGGRELLWRWWRPWSRELHFWTLYRAFGANEIAFHAASLALWLAVLALFFTLARRAAGARAAAIACAGLAALAAWSGALLWAAGVQDLWTLLWALVFLHAFARRTRPLGLVSLALALLSKETAALAPAIAGAWALAIDREPARRALRRVAPYVALCAVWFAVHPTLKDRLFHPERLHAELATHTAPLLVVALRTLGTPFNLQYAPKPETGWVAVLAPALPAIAAVTVLAAWAALGRGVAGGGRAVAAGGGHVIAAEGGHVIAAGRVIALGAAWALLAWLPLFLPSIDWHPYYGLLGAMGAWLALSAWLARAPALAIAVVLGVALLEPAQANTGVWSFSASLYQRRQAYFVGRLRRELLAMHRRLPAHTRLYFSRVPNSIGLGYVWFSPAFSVWYGDSTIRGGFWSSYRPRDAREPEAPDYFFRYDSTRVRWVEVASGLEDVAVARALDPRWREDHRELAALFARVQDWRAAAAEYAKLHAAFPDSVEFAYDAGVASEVAGDTALAARSYGAVLESPLATEDQRAFARGFGARLRTRRRTLE